MSERRYPRRRLLGGAIAAFLAAFFGNKGVAKSAGGGSGAEHSSAADRIAAAYPYSTGTHDVTAMHRPTEVTISVYDSQGRLVSERVGSRGKG